MLRAALVFLVSPVFSSGFARAAGVYAPAAGQPGSTAIIDTSLDSLERATAYLAWRRCLVTFQTRTLALGLVTDSTTGIVSLGDSGQIKLTSTVPSPMAQVPTSPYLETFSMTRFSNYLD